LLDNFILREVFSTRFSTELLKTFTGHSSFVPLLRERMARKLPPQKKSQAPLTFAATRSQTPQHLSLALRLQWHRHSCLCAVIYGKATTPPQGINRISRI
jgi:hypothetical protein